jgi:hypothetical protein
MDPRFVESGSTWYCSPVAGEQTKTLKSTAGKLFYLRVANTTNVAHYAHVYDNTTGSGTPLCPPLVLPANGERELQLRYPMQFSTGASIASSTSQTSVTGGAANDLQIHALYK